MSVPLVTPPAYADASLSPDASVTDQMTQFLAWQKLQQKQPGQMVLSPSPTSALTVSPTAAGVDPTIMHMQMQMQMMQMMMIQQNNHHDHSHSVSAPVINISNNTSSSNTNTQTVGAAGKVEPVTAAAVSVDPLVIRRHYENQIQRVQERMLQVLPEPVHWAGKERGSSIKPEAFPSLKMLSSEHPHNLTKRDTDTAFKCDHCEKTVLGVHYGCQPCDYNLCWVCSHIASVGSQCRDIVEKLDGETGAKEAGWYALKAWTQAIGSRAWPRYQANCPTDELAQKAVANMKHAVALDGSDIWVLLICARATTWLNFVRPSLGDVLGLGTSYAQAAREQTTDPEYRLSAERTIMDIYRLVELSRPKMPPQPRLQPANNDCCTLQ